MFPIKQVLSNSIGLPSHCNVHCARAIRVNMEIIFTGRTVNDGFLHGCITSKPYKHSCSSRAIRPSNINVSGGYSGTSHDSNVNILRLFCCFDGNSTRAIDLLGTIPHSSLSNSDGREYKSQNHADS